jgi:hypothetical protein
VFEVGHGPAAGQFELTFRTSSVNGLRNRLLNLVMRLEIGMVSAFLSSATAPPTPDPTVAGPKANARWRPSALTSKSHRFGDTP